MCHLSLSVLLLFVALCGMETISNCPYEQCVCGKTFTICRDRNLTPGAPNTTGLTTPTIDIDEVQLLPGGVLPAKLTEIYLHDSPIASINEDAFDDSANTVITLSLSNCRLTKIPDALLYLHALKYLTISDTNIQDWNADIMTQIGPNVITLFISNVGLSIWPTWMKSFTNLTEMSFEGSTLSYIPEDAFSLMKQLTSLSLDNNKLHEVPRALSGLTILHSLYLEDNLISNITWLPKSSSLSTLSLGGNKLSNSTHISKSLLPYANSLTDIDFENNQLTSIPELDFLAQVDSLDFSKNKLSSSNSGTFPAKLDYLDISSNLFSQIPSFILTLKIVPTLALSSNIIAAIKDTDFPSCITFVKLDNNRITQLTDTSFPVDSGIVSLNLDDNPLRTISPLAFNSLSNLTYLSLKNSYLTRLPLALSSLTKLTLFDITGSRYLICTCEEKSLDKWVDRMSASSLKGDCGLTSISVFFATLSPRCPTFITAATKVRSAANLVALAP